jgi:hypothetical protein
MLSRVVLALGLVAMLTGIAAAEAPGYFCRGTWTATGYGTYVKSFTGQEAKMGSGAFGIGYYFFDNLSLSAEVSGYYDVQAGPISRIASGDLLLRNHLLRSGRFSLFLDGVAGISYADRRTPYPLGTHYNYIVEPGIGATFQIHENLHLIGGMRYFHLSNAHLEGPIRNPSINGTQAYVGLMYKF